MVTGAFFQGNHYDHRQYCAILMRSVGTDLYDLYMCIAVYEAHIHLVIEETDCAYSVGN